MDEIDDDTMARIRALHAEARAEVRTAEEVAKRCLALIAVVDRAHGNADATEWAKLHAIDSYWSESERAFFEAEPPSEGQVIDASWRSEALAALLWALEALDALPPPNQPIDLGRMPVVARARENPAGFLERARLRTSDELIAAEEEYYGYHWEVRDAALHGTDVAHLDPGVVVERRYALSWLKGDGDDWDDVPTDT